MKKIIKSFQLKDKQEHFTSRFSVYLPTCIRMCFDAEYEVIAFSHLNMLRKHFLQNHCCKTAYPEPEYEDGMYQRSLYDYYDLSNTAKNSCLLTITNHLILIMLL